MAKATEKPKVSVVIQTYNHAGFIAQAIEGALMQETDFPYEIIIGEDESQDGTREICIDYAERYPDKIRLLLRSRKDVIYVDGGPTGRFNFIENMKAARGQYIALCDGDDYWTDAQKLQRQVDFLEGHPDWSLCFHGVRRFRQDGGREAAQILPPDRQPILSIEDLLGARSPVQTSSVMFRKGLVDPLPPWFSELMMADWPLWVLLASHGPLGYIDATMSVYRIHSQGVWSGGDNLRKLRGWLEAHLVVDHHFGHKYHKRIELGKAEYLVHVIENAFSQLTVSMSPRQVVWTFRAIFERYMDSDAPLEHELVARLYARCFFDAADRRDYEAVRQSFLGLLRYDRSWLLNRGVWSIAVEALLGPDAADRGRRLIRWPTA